MMIDHSQKKIFVKNEEQFFFLSSSLKELEGHRARGNPLRRLARERLNDPATAPFPPCLSLTDVDVCRALIRPLKNKQQNIYKKKDR